MAATILIWGFTFIPLKRLTNAAHSDHPLSPEGFLFLRFVPLLPLLLLLAAVSFRRERREVMRRDWAWIILLGVLVVPGYHLPANLALRTPIHTGLISLILNLCPVCTYFLAVAFGQERARGLRTAGVLVAFAGIAVIFAEEVLRHRGEGAGRIFSWEGTGWMGLSVVSWTLYSLIARRIARDHDPIFLFSASAAAGTLLVLAGAPCFLTSATLGEYGALDALDWASWAYVSLLSSFFAYWAWILALRRYEASRLSSAGNLHPLLAHAAAAAFLPREREAFTPWYLLGAAITLAGTFLVVRRAPGEAE